MSTVISKYAYKAVWDASDLTKGLMNSRALFQQQKKIVEDSRTPMERLAIGQQNLAAIIEKYPALLSQKLKIEQDLERQYLREEQAVRSLTLAELARLRELSQAERKSVGPSASGVGAAAPPSGLGKAAVAGAVVTAAYAGKNAIGSVIGDAKDALQFSERSEAAFRQFSKSGEKAVEMMARLRTISKDSGVSLRAMAGGVEQLMVRRFLPDEAIDTMYRFAEITGGVPDKMSRLATAMGQVRDMGRLQAEELGQMVDAGWSPMQELMKLTGLTAAELKKQMEAGAISYDLVAQALRNATDAGGDFHGRFNQLKGTIEGAAQASSSAWESAFDKIGNAIKGPLSLFEQFNKLAADATFAAADWVEKNGNTVQPLDTGILPGRVEAVDHKSKFIADQARKFAEDNKNAAAKKAEQDKQKEQSAMAERQKAEAAKMQAANAPTEKGQAYLREQEQSILDLQKLIRGEKDRELTIEEKIVQLRKQLTADGLNKQEVERAVTLERQRDALKQQADAADKVNRKKEFLDAGAQRGFDAVKGKDESKISSMMDLILARDSGKINTGEFDKASRELVATDTPRRELSPIMSENSEASYKFFANLQNQRQHAKGDYEKTSLNVQKLQLEAQKKLVELAQDPPFKSAG